MQARRPSVLSSVVALAVVGVAVVAVVDAVRSSGPQAAAAPVVLAKQDRARVESQVRSAGLGHSLVLTGRDCRLAALPLPELTPLVDLRVRACDAAVSPRAPLRSSWFVWHRPPLLVARCAGAGIKVSAPGGKSVGFIRGCEPAWLPDGTLSYVRRGEVTHFPPAGRAELLLSRGQLELAFGARRNPQVRDLAWETGDRAAALVALERPEALVVAVFVDGRLVRRRTVPAGTSALGAAPGGARLFLLEGRDRQPVVLGPDLRQIAVAGLETGVLGASWSPDGRWLALAERTHVDLVEVGSGRRIRLPVAATAVAWR